MNKIKISQIIFSAIFLAVFLPMLADASDTSVLPTGWNQSSHTTMVSQVNQYKNFIFRLPVFIGAIFALAMATYHAFREGSPMPLLVVFGIIIIVSLVPLILDMLQPGTAAGMTLDVLKNSTISFTTN